MANLNEGESMDEWDWRLVARTGWSLSPRALSRQMSAGLPGVLPATRHFPADRWSITLNCPHDSLLSALCEIYVSISISSARLLCLSFYSRTGSALFFRRRKVTVHIFTLTVVLFSLVLIGSRIIELLQCLLVARIAYKIRQFDWFDLHYLIHNIYHVLKYSLLANRPCSGTGIILVI